MMEQETQKTNEEITTIPELAKMIRDSFQGNQEYMDEMKTELKADIKKVSNKLDIFIDDYKSEKLPMRVEFIENTLNISPHKK